MDRLIHTADGELKASDPFSVPGTRVYYVFQGKRHYGTIDEEALRRTQKLPKRLQHDDAVSVRWDHHGDYVHIMKTSLFIGDEQ